METKQAIEQLHEILSGASSEAIGQYTQHILIESSVDIVISFLVVVILLVANRRFLRFSLSRWSKWKENSIDGTLTMVLSVIAIVVMSSFCVALLYSISGDIADISKPEARAIYDLIRQIKQ